MTSNEEEEDETGAKHQWPNLYEEATTMMLFSIFIPAMANIRSLARDGKLPEEDAEAVLSTPLAVETAVDTVVRSKDILLAEHPDDIGVPSQIQAFEILKEHSVRSQAKLDVYDDESRDNGLVYGIGVNPGQKRITIAFRGTSTMSDWKADFTAFMTEFDNPLADKDKRQPKQLGMHLGFARYLFAGQGGTERHHGKPGPDYDPDSTKGSKFNAIVNHVRRLLKEFPGYHIYCTGHSLGGALASMTAFFLAVLPEVPSPVTCITFGQPLVGDWRWRRAFQWMEDNGKIRCARVVNNNDLIPCVPVRGGKWSRYFFRQANAYKHVGNEVELLSPDKQCLIALPSDRVRNPIRLMRNVGVALEDRSILQYHVIHEYATNHMGMKDTLKTMYLDDLYKLKEKVVYRLNTDD